MQRWAVFGLTLLAACSGGGGQVVLSGGPEFPTDGDGIDSTAYSGPLGQQSFALLINDVRAANWVAIVMENATLNARPAHPEAG